MKKIVKEFQNKIELQINLEREEMTLITTNIGSKFKEYKQKLIEIWNLLNFFERNKCFKSNGNTVETQNE